MKSRIGKKCEIELRDAASNVEEYVGQSLIHLVNKCGANLLKFMVNQQWLWDRKKEVKIVPKPPETAKITRWKCCIEKDAPTI